MPNIAIVQIKLLCNIKLSHPEKPLVRVNGTDGNNRNSLRMPFEGLVCFSTFRMMWTFSQQMVSTLLLHNKHVWNINWSATVYSLTAVANSNHDRIGARTQVWWTQFERRTYLNCWWNCGTVLKVHSLRVSINGAHNVWLLRFHISC
jgi:hypothetical protein